MSELNEQIGRVPQAEPGSREPSPSVSAASAASIPRAAKRPSPEPTMLEYFDAYRLANGKEAFFDLSFENGWIRFINANTGNAFDRKRVGEVARMAERLRVRAAASATEARRAETHSGSVYEGAASDAETPNP